MEEIENKKKKNKKENIVLFFIKMILLFIIVINVTQWLPTIMDENIKYYKYGSELIFELFWAFAIIIVMLLSKNSYVFAEKKSKFWKSLKLGLPVIIISIISLITNAFTLNEFNLGNFTNLLFYAFSVGVAEEFLCRGWVQNEFIERFGKNRKQVIWSIVLSAFIFGGMHLGNVFAGQTLFVTLLQVAQTTAVGTLLGVIYYRTKNIWVPVFLHGFYDFSIMLGEVNSLKDCTTNNPSQSIAIFSIIVSLLLILIYILNSVILFRKSKINPIINTEEIITEEQHKKDNIMFKVISSIIGVLLLFMSLPIEMTLDGVEDYQVCYEYKEKEVDFLNTESHLPKYETFDIKYDKTINNDTCTTVLLPDGTPKECIPTVSSEKFDFSFYVEVDKDNNYLLTIKNNITNEKIALDYEYVYQFVLIENEKDYTILIHNNDYLSSTIYYSNFITKDNISNTKGFLDELKKSFKKFEVPKIDQIGYMTTRENNYKYPYMITDRSDKFIIDEKGELYFLEL